MVVAVGDSFFKFFSELYKYRYVTWSYIYITLKLRYRRSILGFVWTVLAPLSQYFIIAIVFRYASNMQTENYYAYFFSGAVVFNVFSVIMTRAPQIMLGNEHFIKKIYLPKFIYVLNAVLYELVNFLLTASSLMLIGFVLGYLKVSWSILFLPVAILLMVLALMGLGVIISIVGVYLRDLNYIMPPVMQAVFFGTPIAYHIEVLPEKIQRFINLNPFYHLVELFRQPLVNGTLPSEHHMTMAAGFSLTIFLIGFWLIKIFDNKIVFKL